MELNLYLLLALLIALLVIGYLLAKLHRVRGQLAQGRDLHPQLVAARVDDVHVLPRHLVLLPLALI